jgi:cytochrome c peroxidase
MDAKLGGAIALTLGIVGVIAGCVDEGPEQAAPSPSAATREAHLLGGYYKATGPGELTSIDFYDSGGYRFRTTPLWNVALTAPYMHEGVYPRLEDAVRQHLDAATYMRNYDESQLKPESLRGTGLPPGDREEILSKLDLLIANPPKLTDDEVGLLVGFLGTLTDPRATDMSNVIPAEVPSGLPIDR